MGMLGDIIIAEPRAAIGFAGPRSLKRLLRGAAKRIPAAEYLLDHGVIDVIMPRKEFRDKLCVLLFFGSYEGIRQGPRIPYSLEKFGIVFDREYRVDS